MRLSVPQLGAEELEAVKGVLDSGYLTQGKVTEAFENRIREFVGVDAAFAVSSATTGLQLSLHALGVERDQAVLMPAFSFPATANAVIQHGAIPVFVDIEPDTMNIDANLLSGALTSDTAALMPVHAFGLCADMDPIVEFATRHDLKVVEDSACALGGTYQGRPAGSLGDAGVFSFHPRKIITTGEGGMVTTNDPQMTERLKVLRSHGSVRGELYLDFVDAGYNYRMSDVHAAIGLVQMDRLAGIVTQRAQLAAALSERLREIPGVSVPTAPAGRTHPYQSYVVTLADEIDRDEVIRSLARCGIESTLGTYGMHLQPYFQKRFGLTPEDFPNATRAHRQALTLPLHHGLSETDLDRIADELRAAVRTR